MPGSTPTSAADTKPDLDTLRKHVADETKDFSITSLQRIEATSHKRHLRALSQQGSGSVDASKTLFEWIGVQQSLDAKEESLVSRI
jgi:hypothetical protein